MELTKQSSQVGISVASKGENAAKGYMTAKEATQGWIKSTGHHRNMLTPGYCHMSTGFSKTLNTKTRFHWIQLFTGCGDLEVAYP